MAYPYFQTQQINPYQPVPDQLQQYRQNYFPTQSIQSSDDRIFVQGELAAQAYLVAPNSFVRLWDSQANVFYEKRADASGRPYMETFEYARKQPQQAQNQTENKVPTIDYQKEIDSLKQRIDALEKMKGDALNVPKSNADDTTV